VVPLLNQYRYDDVVRVTRAAKRGLGLDDPVHLFGAGHPMTFALAAACGCDLFDSAAYALYAREGRYLTPSGTRHLDDMVEFPCECAVCEANEPSTVLRAEQDEREKLLAEHNLRTSLAELRRVREAIRRGRLFDLLERRARGHPAVLDGYRALLADETLERTDPTRKATFFAVSPESADRPEVRRHHDRLARLDVPGSVVLAPEGVHPDSDDVPAAADGVTWRLLPPFGPVPPGLAETHPLSVEGPYAYDVASLERTADGVAALADAHPETDLTVVHDGWPEAAVDRLPDDVTVHLAAHTKPSAEVEG
jgi:7-cyano-7-deazaguanine tRNA-ribosyltransferase